MTHPQALHERAAIARFIEARADKVARHGGRRTARQLRAVAGDVLAEMHLDGR